MNNCGLKDEPIFVSMANDAPKTNPKAEVGKRNFITSVGLGFTFVATAVIGFLTGLGIAVIYLLR